MPTLTAEKRLQATLKKISEAEAIFASLMCVPDWTARIMMEEKFSTLREACERFAQRHHGVGAGRSRKQKPKKGE